MLRSLIHLFFGLMVLGLASCEDPIDVNLDNGKSQLAVDGLIFVNDGPQKIRLTMTLPYFQNGNKAPGASGAVVEVNTSKGRRFTFTENPDNPGDYWFPDTLRGDTGEVFSLRIVYQGQTFVSQSTLVRGVQIDTINPEQREAEFGNEAGTYVNMRATDPKGVGDYFWIRYALNGQMDLRPGQILVGADAAFNPGDADGLEFIYPVRNVMNGNKGYLPGDRIDVQLISIDAENFRFLTEMNTQIKNTGLFAEPAANVRPNVFNQDPKSDVTPVGCFGVGRISRGTALIP